MGRSAEKASINENSNFTKTCLSQSNERGKTNRNLATRQAVREPPTHFPGGDSTVRLSKVGGCWNARWGWLHFLARSRAATIKGYAMLRLGRRRKRWRV